MIVNTDTLAAIRTDFQALFLGAYAGFTSPLQGLATEFPNTSDYLDLSWLGAPPVMKEWVDEKAVEGLSRYRHLITNKDWEATLGVKRTAIERDQLGIYTPRIQEMAVTGKLHLDEILSSLLTGGTSGLAYDGTAFFADTRVVGDSGNIDNLLAGTGVTQATFAADFNSARAALLSFKNNKGKPANPVVDLVAVVPAGLQGVAEQTLNATTLANGESNTLKGAARLVVDPFMAATDANDWYLLNVWGPIRPLAMSMVKRPTLVALDNPQSDHVFKHGEYLYSVEGSYNAGYLLPWKAVKTVNG
jgi:phage major head subunit gpT-like protein